MGVRASSQNSELPPLVELLPTAEVVLLLAVTPPAPPAPLVPLVDVDVVVLPPVVTALVLPVALFEAVALATLELSELEAALLSAVVTVLPLLPPVVTLLVAGEVPVLVAREAPVLALWALELAVNVPLLLPELELETSPELLVASTFEDGSSTMVAQPSTRHSARVAIAIAEPGAIHRERRES